MAAVPDVAPVTVPPLNPVAPLPPIAPVAPVPPLAPTAPVAPVVPPAPVPPAVPAAPAVPALPVTSPPPVPTSPTGSGIGSDGRDYRVDAFAIAPVVGAQRSGIYHTETITVTGLTPGVTIHAVATGSGYLDAAAETLTGSYGPVADAFQVGNNGSFVMRVMGVASDTPGATVSVNVSIVTYWGYGETYHRGLKTTEQFLITTAP